MTEIIIITSQSEQSIVVKSHCTLLLLLLLNHHGIFISFYQIMELLFGKHFSFPGKKMEKILLQNLLYYIMSATDYYLCYTLTFGFFINPGYRNSWYRLIINQKITLNFYLTTTCIYFSSLSNR